MALNLQIGQIFCKHIVWPLQTTKRVRHTFYFSNFRNKKIISKTDTVWS